MEDWDKYWILWTELAENGEKIFLILSFYSVLSALECKKLESNKELLDGLETAGMQGYQLFLQNVSPKLILLAKQDFKILPSFFGSPPTFKVKEEIYGYVST